MKYYLCIKVILLLSGCAPTVTGHLKTANGAVVTDPDARVNITRLSTKGEMDTIIVLEVSDDGTFATDVELPPGSYLVEALVPGYRLASQRIELKENATLEFALSALERAKPSTIGANVDVDLGRGSGGATLTPPKL